MTKLMRGRALAMPLLVLLSNSGVGFQGTAPKTPVKPRPVVARISDKTLAALQESARNGSSLDFLGLFDEVDGQHRLYVSSARSAIGFKTAKAAESEGRYTPPATEREDLVTILCGDADLGETFECSSVKVRTPAGKRIPAHSHEAGTNTYSNALGARWKVRTVSARFPIGELKGGFLVDYSSTDGSAWTFTVSEEDAVEKLLLTMGEDSGARSQVGLATSTKPSAGRRKVKHVEPIYPEIARAARVQGMVMVQVDVNPDGSVADARILRSIPLLDQAALDAVRQWVYEPTTSGNPTFMEVVNFRLRTRVP